MSWRALTYLRQKKALQLLTPEQLQLVNRAQDVWAEFLRGERPHPGEFQQHLIPFEPMGGATNFGINSSTMFVYSKFGRFAIFGFVRLNYPKQWVGSKVKLRGGFLKPRQYVLPTQFGEFLADRANRVWEIMSGISDAQQKNINDTIRSDLDGFANSDMFRAIQFDVDAFGHAALRK